MFSWLADLGRGHHADVGQIAAGNREEGHEEDVGQVRVEEDVGEAAVGGIRVAEEEQGDECNPEIEKLGIKKTYTVKPELTTTSE